MTTLIWTVLGIIWLSYTLIAATLIAVCRDFDKPCMPAFCAGLITAQIPFLNYAIISGALRIISKRRAIKRALNTVVDF